MWEKKFKLMVFTFLENALNLGIFTPAPLPTAIRRYEDDLEH